MSQPKSIKVSVTDHLRQWSKNVEVVDLEGDLSDPYFLAKIYRDAKIDTKLKSFNPSNYSMKIIASREIVTL